MIITFILNLIYAVVYLISSPIRLLDNVSVADSTLFTVMQQVSTWLKNINDYAPVDTFLTILAALITIELLVAVYKLIMWAIRRIPGQG